MAATPKSQAQPLTWLFPVAVIAPVLAILAYSFVRSPEQFLQLDLLFWIIVLAVIELFPVPSKRGLQLSLGFPIRLAVAILYPPTVAAGVAFVGLVDMRELTGHRPILLALFDRAQIALAVLAGSTVFHALATVYEPASSWFVFLPAVMAATVVDYSVNVAIVAAYLMLTRRSPLSKILDDMRLGGLWEFLLSYLGLSLVGAVISKLYLSVEQWAVVAFMLPLLFARQMFFRTMALEEATDELKDRERLLRQLSDRMAEERHDERIQIANYLHDELAQLLFRLSLQVDLAQKRLNLDDPEGVRKHLETITQTKVQASEMVRALIRDLHRSPIGRAGLAEAIQSFVADAKKDSSTTITCDIGEVSLPPAIQLLLYQIAREATMNAVKHARADHIHISVQERQDGIQLEVRDDGRGFDPEVKPVEGHFGMVMMRERAQLAGGTFEVQSAIGRGTSLVAKIPPQWKVETRTEEQPPPARAPIGTTTGPISDVTGVERSPDPAPTAGPSPPPDETKHRPRSVPA
jgi:signal transduction histidine kinase